MAYGLTLVTPATAEPLTLAEARKHLRLGSDETSQDDLVQALVAAAREYAEKWTNRTLVTSTWKLTLDRFPRYSQAGGLQYQAQGLWDQRIPLTELSGRSWPDRAAIRLMRSPVQAVASVAYRDGDGNLDTLDASAWQADLTTEPARVTPAYGQSWPIPRLQLAAVEVSYVAGYGPVTSAAATIAAGSQTVTPASMTGIYVGTKLLIQAGQYQETVAVTAVTSTTFTATFARAHTPAPITIQGAVPEGIRQAMKLMLTDWFENRGDEDRLNHVPRAVDALLSMHWTGEL